MGCPLREEISHTAARGLRCRHHHCHAKDARLIFRLWIECVENSRSRCGERGACDFRQSIAASNSTPIRSICTVKCLASAAMTAALPVLGAAPTCRFAARDSREPHPCRAPPPPSSPQGEETSAALSVRASRAVQHLLQPGPAGLARRARHGPRAACGHCTGRFAVHGLLPMDMTSCKSRASTFSEWY